MLFEAHGHFQELGDIDKVQAFLSSAPLAKVGGALNCTVAPKEWQEIREIGRLFPRFIPYYGIHPWKVLEAPADWQEQVKNFLKDDPRAGVGECGLDKVRKDVDFETQKKFFRGQLEISRELKRPYVMHCVRAWDWTVKILEAVSPQTPFILHFFNGPVEIMEKLIRMGGYISFNARQMDRKDDRVRELMKAAPLERMLLETDFPYLGLGEQAVTPEVYVGRFEQWYAEAARIKEMPLEKFTEGVAQNGKIFTDRTADRA